MSDSSNDAAIEDAVVVPDDDGAQSEDAVQEPAAEAAQVPAGGETDKEPAPIEVIASERDVYRDTLQILQADFENYRKRTLKQQTETTERANEALVQKLLPVLDTIDLAKAHDPADSVEQIATALLEVLTKEGLERIPAVNEPFDPTQHSAVAHEPGEGEPRVSEELRAGYRWKGRVLRPAMVKVIG